MLTGDVVEGFAVVANGTPNMTVYVQPGSGRISTGTYPSSYGYLVSHDTGGSGESVTISTAAASPRIDYVVAYVDKTVAGSTNPTFVNNTNNVLKFAAVAGTPAGSPSVPTTTQINTAIGASNPYIILAQIAVGVSVTQITNSNITDKRSFIGAQTATNGVLGVTLGYAQITSSATTGNSTATQVAGLSLSITVPAGGRRVKLTAFTSGLFTSAGSARAVMSIWDGVVGSGTELNEGWGGGTGTPSVSSGVAIAVVTPTPGSKTYNVGLRAEPSGTANLTATTTAPAFLLAELI